MNREKTIIRTSIIGIISNIILVIGKVIIGFIVNSISIINDGINNFTDALSSIITIVGTKLSNKKPNKKHPFGFGRIEFLSSSIIGVLIFVAGFMAIYESINNIINKQIPDYSIYSLIIIGLAILVKVFLGFYFKKKGKLTNSDALSASGVDALSDSILSLSTLICAIISYLFNIYLESCLGIIIGLFIIKSSISVFKESISKIIGQREDKEYISDIIKDINEFDEVKGVFDLIINNYGNNKSIGSVHVLVRDDIKAKEIQLLEREIAYMCYDKYNIIMTVGIYAENINSEFDKQIYNKILKIVSNFPLVLQTHGFYIDHDKKIIGIDVIISFDCEDINSYYQSIYQAITKEITDYKLELVLDTDFTLSPH